MLDALQGGPTSRAAISRSTGLSKPTVSAVIRDLHEAGLVRARGRLSGQIGRSSTLYDVNPTAAYALGVDIGGTKTSAMITDLFGESRAEISAPTATGEPAELIRQTRNLYFRLVDEAGIEPDQVRAAGISVPGVVQVERDRATAVFNVPALYRMRPHRDLEAALGLPVVIGNDVNLAAAAEQWRGIAADVADFVTLWIGTGIGLGIVADGSVRVGAHGMAGEIGQLPLAIGPIDRERTESGPLETAASGPAIEAAVRARVAAGAPTGLSAQATVAQVFEGAAAGDALAREIVEDYAAIYAFAIAAIVAVLDPALIVLGGGVGSNPGLLDPVRRQVTGMVAEAPRIATTALGDRGSLLGAIAVAIDHARGQLLGELRRVGQPSWSRSRPKGDAALEERSA